MSVYKLKACAKSYIWGGKRLFAYGKESENDSIAETWELSFFPGAESTILNGEHKGQKLCDVLTNDEIGSNLQHHPFFPVLIKLIDANDDLSIQVHPSDEYALKYENSLGKTEMWYVVGAEPGAMLHIGFNKETNAKEVEERIQNNTITEIMNHILIKPGDCYFIPSGTLHAIGKGALILEIQENSNLTYRVYDYGRVDKNGNPRELHVAKALKVTNYHTTKPENIQNNLLASCKYFEVKKLSNTKSISSDKTSFICFTILSGNGTVNGLPYQNGDTFFITAGDSVTISGDNELVMTKMN